MALVAAAGVPTWIVCATDGDLGGVEGARELDPELRRGELRCAMAALGVAEPIFLGYGDSGMEGWAKPPGCLALADEEEVVGRLVAVDSRSLRPATIVTFDPGGIYGHPDHVAISARASEAFRRAAREPGGPDDALPPGALAQRPRPLGRDGGAVGGAAGRGRRAGRVEGAHRRRPAPAAALRGAGSPRRGHHDRGRRPLGARLASWPPSAVTRARSGRTGRPPRGRCSTPGWAARPSSGSSRRRCRESGRRPCAAWYNARDVTHRPRRRRRRGTPSERRDRPGGRRRPAPRGRRRVTPAAAPSRAAAGLEEPPEGAAGGRPSARPERRVRRAGRGVGRRARRGAIRHRARERPGRRRRPPPSRTAARANDPAGHRRRSPAATGSRSSRSSPSTRRASRASRRTAAAWRTRPRRPGLARSSILDLRSGRPASSPRPSTRSAIRSGRPTAPWLAFVREKAIWIVGADGSRPTVVADHPAGQPLAALGARRPPHRLRLASPRLDPGLGRRRAAAAARPAAGASRRRPSRARSPRSGSTSRISHWSPDGAAHRGRCAQRDPDLTTMQVHVVDVASGRGAASSPAPGAWETSPRWLPDGSGLLVASDRDGWFQVVRVPLDGGDRTVLTSGPVEHGDYNGGFGCAPAPVAGRDPLRPPGRPRRARRPASSRRSPAAPPAKRGPGRPPKPPGGGRRRPGVARSTLPTGSGSPSAGCRTAAGSLAVGESERDPEDFWILPVPAPDGAPAARVRAA